MGYRLFTLAVFLLAILVVPASGTELVTLDAQWWNGLDEGNQITAVQAANEAYMTGYTDGATQMSIKLDAEVKRAHLRPANAVMVIDVGTSAYTDTLNTQPYFPSTFGTYVHGISDFYANHPDADNARLGAITSCLAKRAIMSCDTVAKFAVTQASNE